MCKKALFFSLLIFSVVSFADVPVAVCPGKSGIEDSARFVYCGPAICKPNNDGTTATCEGCYQLVGENAGTLSCEARKPKGDNFISSFSARKEIVKGHKKQPLVFCKANEHSDTVYADCLDAHCTITDEKTRAASCQCKLIEMRQEGESFATEARSCATPDRCNAPKGYVLNGAPTPLVLPLLAAIEKTTGQAKSELTCHS
jgi:hypothetical protein